MEIFDEKRVFDCVVLGAGISGLIAANELKAKGLDVLIVDKGRGVGGRMATRRVGEAKFDHGAQFFTVRDDAFRRYLDQWTAAGLVSPWFFGSDEHPRFRVNGGMTMVAKSLAKHLDVRLKFKVERLSRENGVWSLRGPYCVKGKSLLLSAPAPQSVQLLKASEVLLDPAGSSDLEAIQYRKAIALMVILEGPSGVPSPGFLKMAEGEDIDVISDNFQKGISPQHAITVQSGHDFADRYFNEPEERVIEKLLQEASPHLQAKVMETSLHRWRYSKRESESERLLAAFPDINLWLCGDSFGATKVEGAALSGIAAAKMILAKRGG